jgi:excisionase family DNA binding protein
MNGEHTELKFLTLAEAATILQVSKRTILRMIQKKDVPALKVGGQWRLRESQLKKWAEEKESLFTACE